MRFNFTEASTWRGLIMLLTGFGVYVSPDVMEMVIAAGTSVAGLIGIFVGDSKKA